MRAFGSALVACLMLVATTVDASTVKNWVAGSGGGEATGLTVRVRATSGQSVTGAFGSALITGSAGYWTGGGPPRPTSSPEGETELLASKLYFPAPNPFDASALTGARIAFDSAIEGGAVRLKIFDILGRHIVTLVDGVLPAGRHHAVWDGRDKSGNMVGSGFYFVRLQVDHWGASKQILLLH